MGMDTAPSLDKKNVVMNELNTTIFDLEEIVSDLKDEEPLDLVESRLIDILRKLKKIKAELGPKE